MARVWPIQFRDNEEIRLTRGGIWLSDGEEITHQETVRLFHRSIHRETDGYSIRIGKESKKIVVEDTPYFVLGLAGSTRTGWELRLSDESRERLNAATLNYRPGRLVARVKNESEDAKFLNPAYFEILKDLEEDDAGYFLTIQGRRVDLAGK
jgi:hypothetical protein